MHIGLIPDGNRRFMLKKHIKSLLASYDLGIMKFFDFLEWCFKQGANEVTIYALSLENIESRGKIEIDQLFNVFIKNAKEALNAGQIHEKKIKINICGDLKRLVELSDNKPLAQDMIDSLKRLEEKTKDYDSFILNLAIAYGGRQEIVNSVNTALSSGQEITEETIRENLWVKNDPDILIRTSEARTSNFLIWQSAYSEIYFLEKLWQEFEEEDLKKIVSDYNSRDRRYGR